MSLRPWSLIRSEELADARIFRIYQDTASSPRTGEERPFARIESTDWINVIALTPERDVVLVRQYRHGTRRFTLEIPGGMVDPGESPAQAATRELREESGHAGGEPVQLGVVDPNPALFDNCCYTFLIEDCARVGGLIQDPGEDLEVELRPLREIPALIAGGEIAHALVICGFWWLLQRRPDLIG